MTKNWNVREIERQLYQMHAGAVDPYVTGWNNWPCKQDLYRVKFAVDEMLNNTSSFAGEEEWLEEQEKKKMWKVLKK